MLTNIPNLLTIFRIISIPLLIALFYIGGATAMWTAGALYGLAGLSDFLDGYYARKYKQVSAFGRFLDPIADKLVVVVALFLLVAFDNLEGYWVLSAIVIIVREILISGLREFLGPYNVQVHVTKLAKWKTTFQMVFIGFLIIGEHGESVVPYTVEIGQYGLVLAAVITVITGWDYLKTGYKTIQDLDS